MCREASKAREAVRKARQEAEAAIARIFAVDPLDRNCCTTAATFFQNLPQPTAAAGGGGIGGAVAAYHGQQMQQNATEVLHMVAEDVEVLRGQWEQREKPKLERGRVELWRTMRGVQQRLWEEVEEHQEKLNEASLEMARGHADNVGKYRKERMHYRKVRLRASRLGVWGPLNGMRGRCKGG